MQGFFSTNKLEGLLGTLLLTLHPHTREQVTFPRQHRQGSLSDSGTLLSLFFFIVLLAYIQYPLLRFSHPEQGPEIEGAPFEKQKLNVIVILINILQRHEEKQIKKHERK